MYGPCGDISTWQAWLPWPLQLPHIRMQVAAIQAGASLSTNARGFSDADMASGHRLLKTPTGILWGRGGR